MCGLCVGCVCVLQGMSGGACGVCVCSMCVGVVKGWCVCMVGVCMCVCFEGS